MRRLAILALAGALVWVPAGGAIPAPDADEALPSDERTLAPAAIQDLGALREALGREICGGDRAAGLALRWDPAEPERVEIFVMCVLAAPAGIP